MLSLANGVQHRVELDAFGRVEQVYTVGSDADLDESYEYDGLDNLVAVTTGATTDDWLYDEVNRLEEVRYGGTTDITYVWDDFGNLVERDAPSWPALDYSTRSFTLNHDSAFSYDDAGNVTDDGPVTMAWDVEGRMTSATAGPTSATVTYNHMGQRVARKLLNTTGPGFELHELFVYDHRGRLLAVFRKPTPLVAATLHAYVVYAGDHPVAVRREPGPGNGETSYLHTDLQGSLRRVYDAAGSVGLEVDYHPHGIVRSESGSYPVREFAWAGHDSFDELGLAHWGSRVLGSRVPSFVSPDRGAIGEVDDPQSFNRYMYGLGRPGTMVDPTGDAPVPVAPAAGAASFAVGGYITAEGAFTVVDIAFFAADAAAWYHGDATAAAALTSAAGVAVGVVSPGPGSMWTKGGAMVGAKLTGWARHGDLIYVYLTKELELVNTVKVQIHHALTDKRAGAGISATLKAIAARHGLDLDGAWNKVLLPHLGGHTEKAAKFMVDKAYEAEAKAGGDPAVFAKEILDTVIVPALRDPNSLYKAAK